MKSTDTLKQSIQQQQQQVEADMASTTSCSCAPLIWKERYLIVPVDTGEIRVYGNLLCPSPKDAKTHTAQPYPAPSIAPPAHPVASIHVPLSTLTLDSDAAIVQLLPLGADRDTIVALSVEGHVHVARWLPNDNVLELSNSWMTGDFAATCMTAVVQSNVSQPTLLLIGYNSGIIDCWRLLDETVTSTSPTKSRRPLLRKKPECLWRGRVQDLYAVQSLACIPSTTVNTNTQINDATPTEDDNTPAAVPGTSDSLETGSQVQESPTTTVQKSVSDKPGVFRTSRLLIAIIQRSIGEDPPVVHAFDLDAIVGNRPKESHTTTLRIRDDESSSTTSRTNDILSLASFRVPPDPAMGIVETERHSNGIVLETEGFTNINNLSVATPIKFHVPNVVLPQVCRAMALPGSPVVAVTMWNGTVAQLSPGWGVRRDQDQLLFSYPVVAMGSLVYQSKLHWVCGLRGGTCYLIPVADDMDDDQCPTLRVILYPHDVDADSASIYLEGLTAGNLQKYDEGDGSSVPVLLYVMPGGVIEIYSCDLLVSSAQATTPLSEEDHFIEELIEQGCLDMVLRFLQERNETTWAGGDTDALLWKAAHEEAMALLTINTSGDEEENKVSDAPSTDSSVASLGKGPKEPSSLKDLRHMPALQSLLLSLARIDG
jgi:hypothetical protein